MAVSEVLNLRDAEGSGFYASFVELNQYYDLLLIHPDGEIFYTVTKGVDYQTNILSGLYSEGNLGEVVRQAMNTESTSFIGFEPYAPSRMAPVAFLAYPVLRVSLQESNDWQEFITTWSGVQEGEGNIQLVVVLQLLDSTLNAVVLQRTGLNETGESYLVGPDFRLRTSTRDSNRNLAASLNREVSTNGAKTETVRLALEGKSDTGLYQNYNEDWVLASYSLINVHDQTWALITEIQASEVLRSVWILSLVIVVLLLGVVALIV
jgi:methyl-accepting chemotaxis protein